MKLSIAAVALVFAAVPAFAATDVAVPAFRGIELREGGHVVLKHGDVQRVTYLKGSTQFTKASVNSEGTLVIESNCDMSCPHRYDIEIEVTSPSFSGIAVSEGGEIESASGFPHAHSLSLAVHEGGT